MTRRTFFSMAAAPALVRGAQPARLPRKDCFFGMHFDLHPNDKDMTLGRDLDDAMVERFLAAVKPDFVQYDCKGHVGYLGYPSKVSTPAGKIVNDSLEIWRRATAKHGVGLFIHFSGVWDSLAIKQHPEWAAIGANGKPSENQTSTFGPYVDERMIPQLVEAASKYDLDGAWVDGECWATGLDYSDAAVKAFRAATGIAVAPKSAKDKGWHEFREFNRERFRQYVRHYVDRLHKERPSFQIASNWLYSTYVPERPTLPVDFLSGDYLGDACIGRARLEARYLQATGKPWDLMAWGFQYARNKPLGFIYKNAVQLQQEASVVLAQGGGFQIYYVPTRSGYVDQRFIDVMAGVGKFCRARQSFSHKTESVPQVGVLFSKHSLYRTSGRLFGGWGAAANPADGMMNALIECRYSVDVVPDWKLDEVAARYPLIVVPDWSEIGEEAVSAVSKYVEAGGNAMVVGAANAALFASVAGIKVKGAAKEQAAWIPSAEIFANAQGVWQEVELAGAESICTRYPVCDSTRDGAIAATLHRHGKGKIAVVAGPLGHDFTESHAPALRQVIGTVATRLFTPAVQVDGPPTLEVALRKKGARSILHIANATNMQVATNYAALDFVPEVGPVRITVRGAKPTKATLEPGAKPLAIIAKPGAWQVEIPKVHVHAAVVW